MAGRALVFSNPEVVRMISTSFVPYAGDQWYLHRQDDADGKFFWKVAQQGHNRTLPKDATRQGIYSATADGTLLASDHFKPSARAMVEMLSRAQARWMAAGAMPAAPAESEADRRFQRVPPRDGMILNVYTRIPGQERAGKWSVNQAVGRDHMWLTNADLKALVPARWERGLRYPVAPAVAERLVRFHLVDNVRGEPPFWGRDEVREQKLELVVEDPARGRLRLEGLARLRALGGEPRSFDARLQGSLVYDRGTGRFSKLDILAWGGFSGEGPYTRGAPQGRFPLLVAFSPAGSTPADRVPPQASRDLGDYLGTGRL